MQYSKINKKRFKKIVSNISCQTAKSRGYGMIELIMGIMVFTVSALSCALIIATGYTWYQEGVGYCRAVTILNDCIAAASSGNSSARVPEPFQLKITACPVPAAAKTDTAVHPSSRKKLYLLTVSWQTSAGTMRSIGGVCATDKII